MSKSTYKRLAKQLPEFKELHDKVIAVENDLDMLLNSVLVYRSAYRAHQQCEKILLGDATNTNKAKALLKEIETTRQNMLELCLKIKKNK